MGMLKKFTEYWESRLTEDAIKKISAALGSFLILVLAALALPIEALVAQYFGPIWSTFLIIVYGGFMGYVGTFIVTVFGTTKEEAPQPKVLDVVKETESL